MEKEECGDRSNGIDTKLLSNNVVWEVISQSFSTLFKPLASPCWECELSSHENLPQPSEPSAVNLFLCIHSSTFLGNLPFHVLLSTSPGSPSSSLQLFLLPDFFLPIIHPWLSFAHILWKRKSTKIQWLKNHCFGYGIYGRDEPGWAWLSNSSPQVGSSTYAGMGADSLLISSASTPCYPASSLHLLPQKLVASISYLILHRRGFSDLAFLNCSQHLALTMAPVFLRHCSIGF